MTICNICRRVLYLGFSTLLLACSQFPDSDPGASARLDQVVEKLDRSLAHQSAVEQQLQAQQRQLDTQQERLQAMSQDLDRALGEPAQQSCPEVEACPVGRGDTGKVVVGELEEIWLSDIGVALTARMDTGAQTSSLYASDIELFERDGKRWVRFVINDPGGSEATRVERKLRRTVGLLTGSNETTRRPVVKMQVRVGDISQTAEFILSTRTHKGYQALIGRSILSDVMVVDVSKAHIFPLELPDQSTAGVGITR